MSNLGSGHSTFRGVAGAAALLTASVLLSRVLGFFREVILAYRVGIGPEVDAYAAAFQIPDLLNYFLAGGALGIAFVPLYTRARSRGGQKEAQHLLANVLGTLGCAVVVATFALVIWTRPLVAFQFPHFTAEQLDLTVRLTRIVLPAQIAFIIGGVIRAALMAEGRFLAQAMAPLIYNLGVIAGGIFLVPLFGIDGFAWGALIGAWVGPLGVAILEARGRISLGLRFAPLDKLFLRYLLLALPLMLGATLLTVDEWYGRWFGQLGGEGTISALLYARRLMALPVAAVGQAVATALLPTLARMWEERQIGEVEQLVERTLKIGISLGLLAGAATWLLAEPLVILVYQHGAFDISDTEKVVPVLGVLAFAVPAWIAQEIAVRPFYARGDTWRPMIAGTLVAVCAIPFYASWAKDGAIGLATVGALMIILNAIVTLVLMRCVHGSPNLGSLAQSILRNGAIVLVVTLSCKSMLQLFALNSSVAELVIGLGVYLALNGSILLLVGDHEIKGALRHCLRKWCRFEMRGS